MEEGTKRKKTEENAAAENSAAYAQGVPKDLPRGAAGFNPDDRCGCSCRIVSGEGGREVAFDLKRAQDKENPIRDFERH